MTLNNVYYLSPNLWMSSPAEAVSAAQAQPSFHSEIQYGDENAAAEFERDQLLTEIDPFTAARAVQITQQYPWLSPGVVTGAAIAGIQPNDPALQWLAERDARTQDTGGGLIGVAGDILSAPFTLIKGSTRLVTTGFDFLWEEGLARPLRTMVGAQQGMAPGTAYRRAGASIGTRAIGDMFGGEGDLDLGDRLEAFVRNVTPLPSLPGQNVNLGSGWLPHSNVADEQDPQVVALTELLSQRGLPLPQAQAQAIQSVQQSYGTPITQQARTQANEGITITDRAGNRVGISPGRLAAVGLGQTADTIGFNLMSGLGDFAAQIFLDPSNIATAGLSKARLASRVLTNTTTSGSRIQRVFGQNVDQFRNSRFYRDSLLPRLAEMNNMVDIRNSLRMKAGANTDELGSTRQLIAAIRDETDPGRIDELLAPHLGTTIRKSPQPTNVLSMMGSQSRTVGQMLGGSESLWRALGASTDEAAEIARNASTFGLKVGLRHRLEGTYMGRLFSEMPDRMIDTENMDDAFFVFGGFLDNAGFTVDEQSDLLYEFAQLGNADNIGAWQTVKRAIGMFENRIVDALVAKGNDPKQTRAWAHSFTRMFDSQEEWVKYWTDQSGNAAWFPGAKFNVVANGSVMQIHAKPTVHQISELVSRQIPLPDPREMRRVLSETSKIPISKLTATRSINRAGDAVYEANVATTLADFYMGKIWKPMVLLRFAWPVRVIGEEQFRAAASGRFSAVRHPMSWLAFATGRKANRTLMEALPPPDDVRRSLLKSTKGEDIDIPAALEDFYGALASSHGGWLTHNGSVMTVAGYSNVDVTSPQFLDAWAWNLAKANANADIAKRLVDDGIDATTNYLLHDGRKHLRRLRDAQEGDLLTYTQVHQYLQSLEARYWALAGGEYIWWDQSAGSWRNHFGHFVTGDDLPPPPTLDPNQPPLPGLDPTASPRVPTGEPGLGAPPMRDPHPAGQGQFDTDFQPRIQRTRERDWGVMGSYLDPVQTRVAEETGRVPGIFADSRPLDRTWGQFTDRPDEDVVDFLMDSMSDYRGGTDFHPLWGVDENLDVAVEELLKRYPDPDELRGALRQAYNRAGRDIAEADVLYEFVDQYRVAADTRMGAQMLNSSSQYTGEALDVLDGRNVIRPDQVTNPTAATEALLVSSLLEQIALLPRHATANDFIRALDDVADELGHMQGWTDEMDEVVATLRSRFADEVDEYWDNLPIEDFTREMFGGTVPIGVVGPEGTGRLVKGYISSGKKTVSPTVNPSHVDSAVVRLPDGEIPSLSLSRIITSMGQDNFEHFVRTGRITEDTLSEWASWYLTNTAPNSLAQAAERNGYRILNDIGTTGLGRWVDELMGEIDTFASSQAWSRMDDTWHLPRGTRDPQAVGSPPMRGVYDYQGDGAARTRLLYAAGSALRQSTSSLNEGVAEILMQHVIGANWDRQPDLMRGVARFVRDDLVASQRRQLQDRALGSYSKLLEQAPDPLTPRLRPSLFGSRSVRSVVSDILQYGETWKGMDSENGLVMWSENIREAILELNGRRAAAIGNGTLDRFDDEVVDAIAQFADDLGVDANALYDSFDDAMRNGSELAGMTATAPPSYRAPMTAPGMPQVVADEMQARTVTTADAWRQIGDDEPVYVYVFASPEEARLLTTEGFTGEMDMLVTPRPDVAQYYNAALMPSGPGLPGLGHGREGDPLVGILQGGKGQIDSNMLGPGLYSTSNGDVLSGYSRASTGLEAGTPTSVSQIMWLGDEAPVQMVLEDNLTVEFLDELEAALHRWEPTERFRQWGDQTSKPADAHEQMVTYMQGAIDAHREMVNQGVEISRRNLWNEFSSVSDSSIIANDLVVDMGYDVIRHEGGLNSGGQKHQTFIWPWKTQDKGLLEASPIEAGPIPRARGGVEAERLAGTSMSSRGKLVALRVRKGDVQPSVMHTPSDDPAEIIMSMGMGARLSRPTLPEEARIVSRDVWDAAEGQLSPYVNDGNWGWTSDTIARWVPDYQPSFNELKTAAGVDGEVLEQALNAAQARGLRVTIYRDPKGRIGLTVMGGKGQIVDASVDQSGTWYDISGPYQTRVSGHLLAAEEKMRSTHEIANAVNRLTANANGGAWYRTRRTITADSGQVAALEGLPRTEAALLRSQLSPMPEPRQGLQALPDTPSTPTRFVDGEDGLPPNSPLDPFQEGANPPEVPQLFHLRGEADPQLLRLMADGKMGDGIALPGPLEETSEELMAHLAGLRDSNRAPAQLPYRKLTQTDEDTSKLDNALAVAFYYMMSAPTNYLSRSPVWKQSYIQRVLELRSFATREVQQQIDELLYGSARSGGFGLTKGEARKILGQTPFEAGQSVGDIANIKTIDEIAKAFALETTKDLLYDASKRHNISDITRNIFPFAEAWAEVIGVWSRIAWEHPEILRRAQQGIEGARESGIFYENENGEEVFAYPALDLLGNWMIGSGDQSTTQFTGRVSGLNIALGGFVPGFGPLVQLPVSAAAEHMPVGMDWVSDLVLPFGAADVTYQPGDLLNAALPAYAKRFLSSFANSSEQAQQTYFNTVIDVFKMKSVEDPRILSDPTLADLAMQDAYGDARELSLLRGFAQFFLPTGPSITYNAADREGKWWTMQALGSEYYRMLRENDGDQAAATNEFVARFGYNPMTFTTSKTVRSYPMPSTASGDEWARRNADLFDKSAFPTTAYYAMPDVPWEPFDWDAYRRQLEMDARQGVDPQVWLWRRNQLLGGVAYDQARARIGDRTDRAALTWLRQIRSDLIQAYPGFGMMDLPGVPGRATLDQKIIELEQWNSDPRLGDSNAGRGLAVYMELRQKAQMRSLEHGLSPSGFQTAQQMAYIRQWLRENAANIMAVYPDFSSLWFDVFAAELEEDRAPTEPMSLAGMTFKESA